MSIPIYNELEVHYDIEQELALVGDVTAQVNTKYISQGNHTLELPDVDAVKLGSVVVLEQQSGTGIINDRVSHYGLIDEGGELNTLTVETGETVGVYLHSSFGRKQWVQISNLLFVSISANYTAIQEVFTVPDIVSRDVLPIGGGVDEVSDGDVAIVLDCDGQGTQQNYQYFADTGWIISTELTSTYEETFFTVDITARDALPTGVGVNNVSVGDNVIVADGDGAGTKHVYQWTGDIEGYVLVFSEDNQAQEDFTVADIAARDALTIGPGNNEVSNGDTIKVNDYDGYGNAALYTYYTDSGYVLTATYGHEAMLRIGEASKEQTGWVDNDAIVSSYNPTTRQITLTHPSGELKYLWRNSLRTLSSPWVSNAHPDTAGNYFLQMTDGETAIWTTSVWEFENLQMGFVTYDQVDSVRMGVHEAHGIMPYETHRELHFNIGTWKEEGTGELTGGTYALDSALDIDITPGVDVAYINDEDIRTALPALIEGSYTTHYLSGAGISNLDTEQPFPFRTDGTWMYANPKVGNSYVDVALSNGDFVNVWCILIPAMSDAESQKYRFIWQVGHTIHSSLDAALQESPIELNLGDMSILSAEFTVGLRLTYESKNVYGTTGKVILANVTNINGSAKTLLSSTGGGQELAQALLDVADQTLEQTGFVDNANVNVSYDKTARTVTLTHPSGTIHYVWRDRVRQIVSPWVSDPHADTPGTYFLRSEDGVTFVWDTTDLHEPYHYLHAAFVNYQQPSVNDSGCIREVHGFMPHSTHRELHNLLGTWKENGTGMLTDATYAIAPTTPTDADNTPGVDLTILNDEDSPTTLPALTEGAYTVMYLGAAGASTFVKSNPRPFRVSGDEILANVDDGAGNFSDVAVPNGKFINVYIVAMPMASDVDSQAYRYIWMTGQHIFDSVDLALEESPVDLNFGSVVELATEAVIIGRLTFKRLNNYTTTGQCRIENVHYYSGTSGSLLFIQSSSGILPSHKHSITDILGIGATNGGTAEVLHGYAVGIDSSGNYRLLDDTAYTFAGINTNNDAIAGESLHLRAMGLIDAVVINTTTLTPGTPLRVDIATGKLVAYAPGDKVTPIVAMFVEDIDGTYGLVKLITPFWPKRYTWQLTSMGIITPGSTNILEDDYEGGKLIFVGSNAYLLRARAKFKVPSASQADFGTYRNNDVAAVFSDAMTPSASPDTFGNWQDTLTGEIDTSLLTTGDEIRFTDVSAGTIDGEDLTIQLEFEEQILWSV